MGHCRPACNRHAVERQTDPQSNFGPVPCRPRDRSLAGATDPGCRKGDASPISGPIGTGRRQGDDAQVNTPTSDQRQRFERLCQLRSLYARRGADDDSSVMTLAEVAAYAGSLFIEGPGHVESDLARPDRPA